MAIEGQLGDIDYFGPHRLRPRFSLPMLGLAKAPWLAKAMPLNLLSPGLARALRFDAPVLYSEEASLGRMDAALLNGHGLYPTAGQHMQALSSILGTKAARVVLTVRSPAEWYPSAYAMVAVRRKLPSIEALAPKWLAAERGWRSVVDAVRENFDVCEVFQYEALRHDPLVLLTALIGPLAADARLPHINQSHSAEVLQKLANSREAGRTMDRKEAAALDRAEDRDAPRLRLDPDIAAQLHDRYLAEMAKMRADGISFIGPDPFQTV